MPQSLAHVVVHIIFSTKGRMPLIDPAMRRELHAYVVGILARLGCPSILVNGAPDHLHILCLLSRTLPLAKVVEEIKKGSSKWMRTRAPALRNFHWQNGYGAFSVSQSGVAKVRAYIAGQEEHHRHVSFEDEYRAFLRRHAVDFDERYVWD